MPNLPRMQHKPRNNTVHADMYVSIFRPCLRATHRQATHRQGRATQLSAIRQFFEVPSNRGICACAVNGYCLYLSYSGPFASNLLLYIVISRTPNGSDLHGERRNSVMTAGAVTERMRPNVIWGVNGRFSMGSPIPSSMVCMFFCKFSMAWRSPMQPHQSTRGFLGPGKTPVP